MKRIGFFGGSFNPPHIGHQQAIMKTLSNWDIHHLYVAPVYKHPDGKDLVDYENRLTMTYLLVQPFNPGMVSVSRIEERNYKNTGSGYTCDTLSLLFKETEADHITLILGSDINITAWTGYEEISDMFDTGKLNTLYMGRDPSVSSTLIRADIKDGASLDGLLPSSISNYIRYQGFYK